VLSCKIYFQLFVSENKLTRATHRTRLPYRQKNTDVEWQEVLMQLALYIPVFKLHKVLADFRFVI